MSACAGVVCDSVGESSISAWKVQRGSGLTPGAQACGLWRVLWRQGTHAARSWLQAANILWPDTFKSEAALAQYDELMHKMRLVRPVVETG